VANFTEILNVTVKYGVAQGMDTDTMNSFIDFVWQGWKDEEYLDPDMSREWHKFIKVGA
jgi:hypothetical protein